MTYLNRPIDHINLTVPNLEESLQFYTKVMGFEIMHRFKNGMEFVFMTDGNITYELIENKALQDTVIEHIAYTSEDIKADFDYFNQLGLIATNIGYIDFLFEKGVYYFFIKGAGNERVEFCERKK